MLVVTFADCASSESPSWWRGSAPAWLEAVSTFAAFLAASVAGVAAVVAALYAYRVFRRDTDSARSQHASLVAAWISEDDGKVKVHLLNASELPVYKARVLVDLPRDPNEILELEVVSTAVLPPGSMETKTTRVDWSNLGQRVPRVELRFQDLTGQHWRREATGNLTRT